MYQAQKEFLYEIASVLIHKLSHTWEATQKAGWKKELLMATNPFSFDQQTALLSKELGVMPQENQKVLLGKGRNKRG